MIFSIAARKATRRKIGRCSAARHFGVYSRGRKPLARLCRILALLVILISANAFAAANRPEKRRNARQPSKISPLLQEAEDLLRQGSIDEAKKKIQEQLELNPSSVEGLQSVGNCLHRREGLRQCLEAFQQALKLDPNSTRTLNNLGNLYVAQKKLDLAEKEFRKVLRLEPGEPRWKLQSGPASDGHGFT